MHHTNTFDPDGLILRRGQLFSLTFQLATPISGTNLVTKAIFTLLGKYDVQLKSFEVVAVSRATEDELTVELRTPADAEIGRSAVCVCVCVCVCDVCCVCAGTRYC